MSSFDQSLEEIDFTQTLHDRQVRRVYLITYAEANMNEFPTYQMFSEKLLEFYSNNSNNNNPLTKWVCCQEDHADGEKHYHMVVQFKSSYTWLPIKKYMSQQYGVSLHFSYKYICKKVFE